MLIRAKAGSGSVWVDGLGGRLLVSKSRLAIHGAAIGSWLFGRCRGVCMRVNLDCRGQSKVGENIHALHIGKRDIQHLRQIIRLVQSLLSNIRPRSPPQEPTQCPEAEVKRTNRKPHPPRDTLQSVVKRWLGEKVLSTRPIGAKRPRNSNHTQRHSYRCSHRDEP
jgi:hypothetical protein